MNKPNKLAISPPLVTLKVNAAATRAPNSPVPHDHKICATHSHPLQLPPAPAIFGLEWPSTHQCSMQNIPFWDFLDGMKPNPTPGQGSGFFFLNHTPSHSTVSLFPLPPLPPYLSLTSCFYVPSSFLPFSPLIISCLLLFGSSLFPSLFPAHNFFFLFWDLFFL